MATDTASIIRNLSSFYPFAGTTVVSVGAGGGQLVEYARAAARVFAIDHDPAAIERLVTAIERAGLADTFVPIAADFLRTEFAGDVVVFEFSLHEMPDAAAAIAHARTLAPDVVVIDHVPTSEWSFFTAETDTIAAEWQAIAAAGTRRRLDVLATQHFADYAELHEKLKVLGPPATERIRRFASSRDFTIDMPYAIALLA